MSPAKTAESIEMPFGVYSKTYKTVYRVGQKRVHLDFLKIAQSKINGF